MKQGIHCILHKDQGSKFWHECEDKARLIYRGGLITSLSLPISEDQVCVCEGSRVLNLLKGFSLFLVEAITLKISAVHKGT